MKKKKCTITSHDALILVSCGLTGLFFAFVLNHYWAQIQLKNEPLEFPFSFSFFYVLCFFAYFLQGLAYVFLSKQSKRTPYGRSVVFFWTQFFLSVIWLQLFFGLKMFGLSLFTLFVSFMILLGAYYFFKIIRKAAAFMLVPAGALIAFVAMLNIWFFLIR